MKKIFQLILILILDTSLFVTPTFAQTNLIQKIENQSTQTAQGQSNALDALKKKADSMIDKRVMDLNKAIARIQEDNRLTTGQKTSFVSSLQTNITGLTNLKAKIDADIDLTIARSDAKQIVDSYRIYLVVEPKTRLLVTINNLQTTNTNMQNLSPKLQDLINALKSQGKDSTDLQISLDDINAKVSVNNTLLASDQTKVEATTITDVTGAHNTFVAVRKDLATIRSNFAAIRHDIAQMREDFKGTKIKISSPSASSI